MWARTSPALPALRSPVACGGPLRYLYSPTAARDGRYKKETTMAWTTPTLVEICIGLEINGYLPAEF